MCSDSFWKKIIALCLTFWLGVLSANLFASGGKFRIEEVKTPLDLETMEEKIIVVETQRLNCVPADGTLKYVPLDAKTDSGVIRVNPETRKDLEIENVREIREKETKTSEKSAEEIEKEIRKLLEKEPRFQNLLHRERCFEEKERK